MPAYFSGGSWGEHRRPVPLPLIQLWASHPAELTIGLAEFIALNLSLLKNIPNSAQKYIFVETVHFIVRNQQKMRQLRQFWGMVYQFWGVCSPLLQILDPPLYFVLHMYNVCLVSHHHWMYMYLLWSMWLWALMLNKCSWAYTEEISASQNKLTFRWISVIVYLWQVYITSQCQTLCSAGNHEYIASIGACSGTPSAVCLPNL